MRRALKNSEVLRALRICFGIYTVKNEAQTTAYTPAYPPVYPPAYTPAIYKLNKTKQKKMYLTIHERKLLLFLA